MIPGLSPDHLQQLTNPADRLPILDLPSVPDGRRLPLRSRGRRSGVIVLVHPLDCPACEAFLRELDEQKEAIDEWDGELRVVTTADGATGLSGPLSVPVLLDEVNRLANDFGFAAPAVLITDQWGEIHANESAGGAHRFMPLAEILSWLRYLAMKCPECEGEAY